MRSWHDADPVADLYAAIVSDRINAMIEEITIGPIPREALRRRMAEEGRRRTTRFSCTC